MRYKTLRTKQNINKQVEITFHFLINANFPTLFTNSKKTGLLRIYLHYETRRNTLCSEAWCRGVVTCLCIRLMHSSNHLVKLDFIYGFLRAFTCLGSLPI